MNLIIPMREDNNTGNLCRACVRVACCVQFKSPKLAGSSGMVVP